jgi:magnesium transporter
MFDFLKGMTKRKGLPPGSVTYTGETVAKKVRIRIMDFDENNFVEKEAQEVEECFPFKNTPSTTWINIDGIHDTGIIEKIGRHFDMHPLILEDMLNTSQRPKFEDFDNYIFIIVKLLSYNEEKDEIESEQISLIMGADCVITFQETEGDVFNVIRDRIRTGKGRVRRMGADYLAYVLLDALIDNYFVVLEKIGEKIEDIEDELIEEPTPATLRKIHHLKRETIFLRKILWPTRDMISGVERCGSSLVKDTTGIYLRDLYENVIHVIDSIEAIRDISAGMIDMYLSSLSNKLNILMKHLNAIVISVEIPSFFAGAGGMSEFSQMVGFENWKIAYFLFLVAMVFMGIGIYFLVKRLEKYWK